MPSSNYAIRAGGFNAALRRLVRLSVGRGVSQRSVLMPWGLRLSGANVGIL